MENVGDRRENFQKICGTCSNKEKFEMHRMEMDQKPNLKFNRISNLYVRHMFARLHSNALLNRHDFISRFFQVNTRGQRDFFQGTRRFSRKRGKENGGEA